VSWTLARETKNLAQSATYWVMARRFVAGDAHALDGVVLVPVNEPLVFLNVTVWDGRGGPVQRSLRGVVRDGRVESIRDVVSPCPRAFTRSTRPARPSSQVSSMRTSI
jgi:hypothetical protein